MQIKVPNWISKQIWGRLSQSKLLLVSVPQGRGFNPGGGSDVLFEG